MTEFSKHTDSAIRIIEENYLNETRSAKFAREILWLAPRNFIERERKNAARQLSQDCFVK
jgi:hypothetical protein